MFRPTLVQFVQFLLLIQLFLIPVLARPNPESFVPMVLGEGGFSADGGMQPLEKKRRRRGTILKALAGGAAVGAGGALLYKAFKGRKNPSSG